MFHVFTLLLAFSFTTVQHWITTRGYWGGVAVTFLLLFACGLGMPLPEDVPLIISGAFLTHDGQSWLITGAAAWAGIIGGDCCLYYLGRRFGMEVTRLPMIGRHVTVERIEHVQRLFEKYGVGVVAIGRMFAGIRGAMVICAGTIRFSFWKFFLADGIAAIVSGGLFMLLGWWIGGKLSDPAAQQKIHEFKEWFIGGAIGLAVGLVGFIIWRRRNRRRIEEVEEQMVDRIAHTAERVVGMHPVDPAHPAPSERPNVER